MFAVLLLHEQSEQIKIDVQQLHGQFTLVLAQHDLTEKVHGVVLSVLGNVRTGKKMRLKDKIHAPIDQAFNLVNNYRAHIDVFLDNSHQHAAFTN